MTNEADTRAAQREAPSGLQLVVMASAGSQRVDLPRSGTVTLGRGDTATVKIDDDSISRAHAAIHVRNTVQLEDLGSSNGTFVRLNGPTVVKNGDHVRMGDQLMRIER